MHRKLIVPLAAALLSPPVLASTQWHYWKHQLSHRVVCAKGMPGSPADWKKAGGPFSNAQCKKERANIYNLPQQKQQRLATQSLPPPKSTPYKPPSQSSSRAYPAQKSAQARQSKPSSGGAYTRTGSPWWKWTHYRDRGSKCAQAIYDGAWKKTSGPYKDPSCTVK